MHIQSGQKFFFEKKGEKKELRTIATSTRIQSDEDLHVALEAYLEKCHEFPIHDYFEFPPPTFSFHSFTLALLKKKSKNYKTGKA